MDTEQFRVIATESLGRLQTSSGKELFSAEEIAGEAIKIFPGLQDDGELANKLCDYLKQGIERGEGGFGGGYFFYLNEAGKQQFQTLHAAFLLQSNFGGSGLKRRRTVTDEGDDDQEQEQNVETGGQEEKQKTLKESGGPPKKVRVDTHDRLTRQSSDRQHRLESRVQQGGDITRGKKKGNGKPVEQLDLETGEVIEEFESQAEASRVTGVPSLHISECVNGQRTDAGGFRWRREKSVDSQKTDDDEPYWTKVVPISSTSASSSSSSSSAATAASSSPAPIHTTSTNGRNLVAPATPVADTSPAPFVSPATTTASTTSTPAAAAVSTTVTTKQRHEMINKIHDLLLATWQQKTKREPSNNDLAMIDRMATRRERTLFEGKVSDAAYLDVGTLRKRICAIQRAEREQTERGCSVEKEENIGDKQQLEQPEHLQQAEQESIEAQQQTSGEKEVGTKQQNEERSDDCVMEPAASHTSIPVATPRSTINAPATTDVLSTPAGILSSPSLLPSSLSSSSSSSSCHPASQPSTITSYQRGCMVQEINDMLLKQARRLWQRQLVFIETVKIEEMAKRYEMLLHDGKVSTEAYLDVSTLKDRIISLQLKG